MPDSILDQFITCQELIEGPSKATEVKPEFIDNKYLQAILNITLVFIIGQPVESMCSPEDYLAMNSVNADACEFLEVVLRELNAF